MRGALRIAIVITSLAVPSIAIAAGANQIRAINCGREQYKPSRIILSCADAGIWLGRLRWSSWNRTRAVASGDFSENTCTPTCSAGHAVTRPVTVTLSAPQTCPGRAHPAFRRATFTFPSGAPPYAPRRYWFDCPV